MCSLSFPNGTDVIGVICIHLRPCRHSYDRVIAGYGAGRQDDVASKETRRCRRKTVTFSI